MQLSLFLLFLMGLRSCFTWKLYEYRFVVQKKTWENARAYCRKHHTDLATVSNMTDNERLRSLTLDDKEAWIGLKSKGSDKRIWHWSLPGLEDDNHTKWADDEPNDINGIENCTVIMKSQTWADTPCTTTYPFICYNDRNQSNKYILVNNKRNWLKAQSYCRENHTDLVSGQHQLEDGELKEMVKINSNTHTFIGLFRDSWKWSDGSGFSFRNWHPQNGRVQKKDKCAASMNGEGGWWTAKSCDDKKPFICYDDKVILIKKKMNWEDALYYCRDHHHDLVTITSLDEQRWVQEKAKKANTPLVWTGLRYTCTLDFWFWVSNEEVRYKNWASGQDGDDCDMSGAMERGGKHEWFKTNDNDEFNFICSKS